MRSLPIYLTIILCSLFTMASAQVKQNLQLPSAEKSIESMSNSELWDRANTAYANGNYIKAQRSYEAILARDNYSAELYYNLGNVHHKRDEVGLALLYYYKALRLSPSDSDIRHNIEVVRAKTKDNIKQMPRFFIVEWSENIGSLLSCAQWSVLSIVLFGVMLLALLLYLLSASLRMRRIGFSSLLFVGLLFVLATRHAIIERNELLNPSEAIVMSESLTVSSSPSKGATELFILHMGTKIQILTTHDSWCEIMIDDGKKGWVESGRIAVI